MSTQTKSKLFLSVIAILLLTNIAMLYFLLRKDTQHDKKRNFDRVAAAKKFLQNEIGFTTAQLLQFDSIALQHREKMKSTIEQLRFDKEQLLKGVGVASFSDSAIMQAINKGSENQKKMEESLYRNMIDIRKLCTAAQVPKFDTLFYKMWRRPSANEKK
jgi:hypothetical protein